MQAQTKASSAHTSIPTPRDGVVIVSGYGVAVRVEKGHLVVTDGSGSARRDVRLHRALSRVSRLVVLGHTGCVSLEALRWLYDVGAAFVHIDVDGNVIT